MGPISRRDFVGAIGATAGLGCIPYVTTFANTSIQSDRVVHVAGDGASITPREHAELLNRLSQSKNVSADNYLLGGEVEAFERHWRNCSARRRRSSCRPERWRTSWRFERLPGRKSA
jgi:hypothetical protein